MAFKSPFLLEICKVLGQKVLYGNSLEITRKFVNVTKQRFILNKLHSSSTCFQAGTQQDLILNTLLNLIVINNR